MKTLFEPTYLKRWTLPECYFGAHWPEFYVFLGQSRDSDALERANFDAGLKAVKTVASKESCPCPDMEDLSTVQTVHENH